jgi:ACS family tartrate transporter-like MFS transporter
MPSVQIRATTPAPQLASDVERSDDALERATIRRLSLRLIPFMFVLYVCNYLDRTNLGIASLQMNRDLHFSAAAYGFGAGIFFIGYAFFEVPSNLILARVGARRWIARIMISWGILAAATMFVRTPVHLYVVRFLLGVAEAGFFPGMIYYLSCWFPAAHRARAVSRFMIGMPVSGIVSGMIAGPLLGLQGRFGLAGWQWLFLVEGLPAVLLGIAVLFVLVDDPKDARWLTAEQRASLVARLARERDRANARHGVSLRHALSNGVVWRLAIVYFVALTSSYAYNFWAPQLIAGYSGLAPGGVGRVLAGFSVVAATGMIINGVHSDRTTERPLHVAASLLVAAVGWLMIAVGNPVIGLLGLPLAIAGTNGFHGPFWCMPSTFLTGEAAAGGMALVAALGTFGGFVGPNVVGSLKQATGGYGAACVLVAAGLFIGAMVAARLRGDPRIAER